MEKERRLSDNEVIELAAHDREAAFRELIGRYERPVFSLIYRMLNDREAAEDVAQETFIKVLNSLDRYDPSYSSTSKFSSWIFKIANNAALDHLRKRRADTVSIDGSPDARTDEEAASSAFTIAAGDESPESYAASREIGREIERVLARLRPEYRAAIVLWHIEDRPYDEIARIMELPLGTVKTYIHRARNELREQLTHLKT